MATKEELTNENAVLRSRIAELEAGAQEGAGYVVDTDGELLTQDEWYLLTDEGLVRGEPELTAVRVRDENGEFAEPEEGGVYRYDGSGDFVKQIGNGDAEADARIEMLTKDVTRLEIERNDARNEVARLKGKIADMGSLHGRIDNLPGVVG